MHIRQVHVNTLLVGVIVHWWRGVLTVAVRMTGSQQDNLGPTLRPILVNHILPH